MLLAHSPVFSASLPFLTFGAGCAGATVFFWPLITRAHRRRSGRPGEADNAPTAAPAETALDHIVPARPNGAFAAPSRQAEDSRPGEAAHQRTAEQVPSARSELFQNNHAAGFTEVQKRIQRVRADLDRLRPSSPTPSRADPTVTKQST